MSNIGLRVPSLLRQKCLIGGKWLSAVNGNTFDVTNPATNEVLCNVPDMGRKETETTIDIAYNSFHTWKRTTAKERAGLLRKWFNLVELNKEDLARLITLESGKPIAESRGEIAYGSSYIEWYAEEARRVYGDIPQSPFSNKMMMFIKQPIGVVGLITPWNFPNAMLTRKAGAALAAGCTCVVKPAEDTPLSTLALASLAEEAGIPGGVFNVVTGSRQNAPDIGGALCESEKISGISFTGSTAVGKLLYKLSSSTVKHIELELGGNAPFIVFDSAKLSSAIEGLIIAKFRNAGQTCISANRIYVQSGIHDEFVATLKSTLEKRLHIGNGLDEGVNIGPLINSAQMKKVEEFVEDCLTKGAKKILGGGGHSYGDLFFEPTILTGCTDSMLCFRQEIFGPVVCIQKFETEREVVALANNRNVGLASYFYSQDPAQIFRVSRDLDTGMVGVNEGLISCAEAAFGGVKESGIGREGSKYGIDSYIDVKYICIGDLQD